MSRPFAPLDDLFNLVQRLEAVFGVELDGGDFVIGRKQLFFTFLHELLHAFIRRKAAWVFALGDDEVDFIDEVVVRFLIDDLLGDPELYAKVDEYYVDFVRHRTDLALYGFNLAPEDYDALYAHYLSHFAPSKDVDGACSYVRDQLVALGIRRDPGFSYHRPDE